MCATSGVVLQQEQHEEMGRSTEDDGAGYFRSIIIYLTLQRDCLDALSEASSNCFSSWIEESSRS